MRGRSLISRDLRGFIKTGDRNILANFQVFRVLGLVHLPVLSAGLASDFRIIGLQVRVLPVASLRINMDAAQPGTSKR